MVSQNYYHLVSHHDTILYADLSSKHIRHAPFGIAPWNLVLELVGDRGRLIMTGVEVPPPGCQMSFVEPGGEFRLNADGTAFDCQIKSFADDSIGILAAGKYITADWGGTVVNDRDWCREWERFRLVRADTVEALAHLRRYSWVSHSDRRIVSLADQPIDFGRDVPRESSGLAGTLAPGALELSRDLVFGPACIRLVGRDRTLRVEGTGHGGKAPPGQVHIIDRPGVVHSFSRYNPLVCYCVNGDDWFYECLRLSLISLDKYGCFGGAVGIACDRPLHHLAEYIPDAFHHRLIVSDPSREKGRFNQYHLDHGLHDEYQPILYYEADVIFDASITDLLIDVMLSKDEPLLSGRICCATEAHARPHLAARMVVPEWRPSR